MFCVSHTQFETLTMAHQKDFFKCKNHSFEIRIQTSIWQQLLSDFLAIQW